jgi:hypothetical protein
VYYKRVVVARSCVSATRSALSRLHSPPNVSTIQPSTASSCGRFECRPSHCARSSFSASRPASYHSPAYSSPRPASYHSPAYSSRSVPRSPAIFRRNCDFSRRMKAGTRTTGSVSKSRLSESTPSTAGTITDKLDGGVWRGQERCTRLDSTLLI